MVAPVAMMAACKHGSKGALKERRYLRSLFARCAEEDRRRGVRKEEQATHDDCSSKARPDAAGEREHVEQIHKWSVGLGPAYRR
jgi:hypothetical protein